MKPVHRHFLQRYRSGLLLIVAEDHELFVEKVAVQVKELQVSPFIFYGCTF